MAIGVPPEAVPKLTVRGHTIDLDGDDVRDWIIEAHSTHDVRDESDEWHDVFVIANEAADHMTPVLVAHERWPPGADSQVCVTELLDVLPLTSDRVVDVFVRLACYEGVAYGIYRRPGADWTRVYVGAYYGL